MFRDTRRQKLRNRILFVTLGVMVMAFGIWLNVQQKEETETEDAANRVAVEQTEKPLQDETVVQENTMDHTDTEAVDPSEYTDADPDGGTGTADTSGTYLIKEVDGDVKVFLYDNDGNRTLHMTTSIPFALLSESDQELFAAGVRIETEEELGKFLENFDS